MFGFTSGGWLHDCFHASYVVGWEIKIQYQLQISKFIYFYDLTLLSTSICPIHLDILIETTGLIDLEQFSFYSRYFVPEISLF
jgi:hypothetical protein